MSNHVFYASVMCVNIGCVSMIGGSDLYDCAVSRVVKLLNDNLPKRDNHGFSSADKQVLAVLSGGLPRQEGQAVPVWDTMGGLPGEQMERITAHVKIPDFKNEATRHICEPAMHYVSQVSKLFDQMGIQHVIAVNEKIEALEISAPACQLVYLLQTKDNFERFAAAVSSFDPNYADYKTSHYAFMRDRNSSDYKSGIDQTFTFLSLQPKTVIGCDYSGFEYGPIAPMQAQMVLRHAAVHQFKEQVLGPVRDLMLVDGLCEVRQDEGLRDRYVYNNTLTTEFQDETMGFAQNNAIIAWFDMGKACNPFFIGKNLFALSDNLSGNNIGHRVFCSKDGNGVPCFGLSVSINDYEFMNRPHLNSEPGMDSLLLQMTMDGTGRSPFAQGVLENRFEALVKQSGGEAFYEGCKKGGTVHEKGFTFLADCINRIIQSGTVQPQLQNQRC